MADGLGNQILSGCTVGMNAAGKNASDVAWNVKERLKAYLVFTSGVGYDLDETSPLFPKCEFSLDPYFPSDVNQNGHLCFHLPPRPGTATVDHRPDRSLHGPDSRAQVHHHDQRLDGSDDHPAAHLHCLGIADAQDGKVWHQYPHRSPFYLRWRPESKLSQSSRIEGTHDITNGSSSGHLASARGKGQNDHSTWIKLVRTKCPSLALYVNPLLPRSMRVEGRQNANRTLNKQDTGSNDDGGSERKLTRDKDPGIYVPTKWSVSRA